MKTDGIEQRRSKWLEEISACLGDGYEITEYGKSRIKTVSFVEENAPSTILSHVWHEYIDYSKATLEWLYELGSHPSHEVRIRAAAVAGQLAVYEFKPVRDEVILPWAKSSNKLLQKLAALALTVVAYNENDEIAQQALTLLHHWSSLKNSDRLHYTSVAAYGGYVGFLFPKQALDDLKVIAQSGNGSLFAEIAQAVANLFEAGQQVSNLYSSTLRNLRNWLDEGEKTTIYRLSLLIFWGLMHNSWVTKEGIKQPTLLVLSNSSEELEDLTVFFIKNALDSKLTKDLILPDIYNWLKFVDENQTSYKALARIIFSLASYSNKDGERISWFLRKWSKSSESAKNTLKLIENYL